MIIKINSNGRSKHILQIVEASEKKNFFTVLNVFHILQQYVQYNLKNRKYKNYCIILVSAFLKMRNGQKFNSYIM